MVNPIRRSAEVWANLLAALPETMRDEVCAAYIAPGRHYHDCEHVGGVWATWRALGGDAGDRTVLWAAAYHDLVYDVPAPNGRNEAISATRLARVGRALGLNAAALDEAIGMIEATADHLAAEGQRDRLFCDLDLAGLASDYEGFRDNTERVRREYHMLTDAQFRAGRRAFFAGLLVNAKSLQSELIHNGAFADRHSIGESSCCPPTRRSSFGNPNGPAGVAVNCTPA